MLFTYVCNCRSRSLARDNKPLEGNTSLIININYKVIFDLLTTASTALINDHHYHGNHHHYHCNHHYHGNHYYHSNHHNYHYYHHHYHHHYHGNQYYHYYHHHYHGNHHYHCNHHSNHGNHYKQYPLLQPDKIHVCDGTDAENSDLLTLMTGNGMISKLNAYDNWLL